MFKQDGPVVLTEAISLDYVVYILLNSYLHPIYTWIFGFGMYWYTHNIRHMVFASLVSISHYLSYLNENYKARGKISDDKKNVLITGGSRGLGMFLVKDCLKHLDVNKIFVLDIIDLTETVDPTRVVFYKCDISDYDKLDRVIDEILEKDEINVLINNAGIRHDRSLNQLSRQEIDKIFSVNTFSHIHLLQRITKQAKKLHVITISSILGTIGPRNLSIYSASKAALIQVHESLSYELNHNEDIRFTLFLPGQLNTEMFKEVKVPNKFLAPIVSSEKLSLKIIEVIKAGKRGIYYYPLYCYAVPALKCLPFGLYEFLRRFSNMDNQIRPQIDDQKDETDFVLIE